jgi:hypothetical protein
MERSVKVVRQLCEPYCMMFKELRGEKKTAAIAVILKRKKENKIHKSIVWGEGPSIICGFSLFAGGLGT